MHKEVTDKYCMRKLLVSLSGDETFQSISFGEEVHFDPLAPTGPSGSIDLLIGSKKSSVAEADLQIKLLNDIIIGISNAAMSETKSHHTHLSRVNPQAAKVPSDHFTTSACATFSSTDFQNIRPTFALLWQQISHTTICVL